MFSACEGETNTAVRRQARRRRIRFIIDSRRDSTAGVDRTRSGFQFACRGPKASLTKHGLIKPHGIRRCQIWFVATISRDHLGSHHWKVSDYWRTSFIFLPESWDTTISSCSSSFARYTNLKYISPGIFHARSAMFNMQHDIPELVQVCKTSRSTRPKASNPPLHYLCRQSDIPPNSPSPLI